MSSAFTPKPFPIPVVSTLGAGSQMEDETLDYVRMPAGMDTYQPPRLPEPEELAGHDNAVQVLHQVLAELQARVRGEVASPVSLAGLPAADLRLVNQVLGEGEVSAQVMATPGDMSGRGMVQIQESVFAGIWRVVRQRDDGSVSDTIEVGAVPAALLEAAREDARRSPAPLPAPPVVQNAPAVLTELADHRQHWRAGQMAQVVNLTLLPLTPEDIGFMDMQLGTGRVLILSRGYGNCRITNSCVSNTWRVVYYNSQDTVILNSVEVCDIPEVACAAPEDLADSAERLVEVLQWVEQAGEAA
jgi:hydrogenase-1 operon protein HyaF